jgi:DNA-binding transcriptional regulator YdaS (Cro superfamily)
MNHPLARALYGAGLDTTDVAARLGVDPKTVQRWLAGRIPYPRHRVALIELTGWTTYDLWPQVARPPESSASDEIRVSYAHRSAVPVDAWSRLFARAQSQIGILAYSALFLAEDTAAQRVLREKAQAGVRVRIALGDPAGKHVRQRGADERIDGGTSARIRNALVLFEPLAQVSGVKLRLHDTVLYNSIYRADDELLVNSHIYGRPAAHAPVLHLRRVHDDSMAATYLSSFERVWCASQAC